MNDFDRQELNLKVAKIAFPGSIAGVEILGTGVILDKGDSEKYCDWVMCDDDAHKLLHHIAVSPPGINGTPQYKAQGMNNQGGFIELLDENMNIGLCLCYVECNKK